MSDSEDASVNSNELIDLTMDLEDVVWTTTQAGTPVKSSTLNQQIEKYVNNTKTMDKQVAEIENNIQTKYDQRSNVISLLTFLSYIPYDVEEKEIQNPPVNHHGLNKINKNFQELKKFLTSMVDTKFPTIHHVAFHTVNFMDQQKESSQPWKDTTAVPVRSANPMSRKERKKPFEFSYAPKTFEQFHPDPSKITFEEFMTRNKDDTRTYFGLVDGLHRATILLEILQSDWKKYSSVFNRIDCTVIDYTLKTKHFSTPAENLLRELRQYSKLITDNNKKTIGHTITDGFISCIQMLLPKDETETDFILDYYTVKTNAKPLHFSEDKKLVDESGSEISKASLKKGFQKLAYCFSKTHYDTMLKFHQEMLKVDTYKSTKPIPIDNDLKKYMESQPCYKPKEISGNYIEHTQFKALSRHQLDMLRFLECIFLSDEHAEDILRMVQDLGSQLQEKLILKMNSISFQITNTLLEKLKKIAKDEINLTPGFCLGYFATKKFALLRTVTSAFTYQLLWGVHEYYTRMNIADFEHVLDKKPRPYWNSMDPLTPIEILLTTYANYLLDIMTHYVPFISDRKNNLVAKVYFGKEYVEGDYLWKDIMRISKPTEFADKLCEDTYNALATKHGYIEVPLEFSHYLERLKMVSNNEEQNTKQLDFLLNPTKTIYHAFLGTLEPQPVTRHGRKDQKDNDEKKVSEEQQEPNPVANTEQTGDLNEQPDPEQDHHSDEELNSTPARKKRKRDKTDELLDNVKFLNTILEGDEPNFDLFFDDAYEFTIFPSVIKELLTVQLKGKTKKLVQDKLKQILKKKKTEMQTELNTHLENNVDSQNTL